MNFFHQLYWGESLLERKEEILKKIEQGKRQWGIYLLVLPNGPANQLEIIENRYLLKEGFKQRETLKVVGIAGGYEEALLLLMEMVEDTFLLTGTMDIRSYLGEHWHS